MRHIVCAAALLGAFAAPQDGLADLLITFVDDTPHDRFEIVNAGPCDTGAVEIGIRLNRAEGDLFFDATAAGSGVMSHHPVQFVVGADAVSQLSPVQDGDRSLAIALIGLSPEKRIVIAADIDHGQRASPSPYVGTGISGARIYLISVTRAFEAQAVLDRSGVAELPAPPCAE